MATNASHGSTATPSKDSPSNRGRDGRKATHNDDSTDTTNKVTQNRPPTDNRNNAARGSPAKFLQWLHPDTPLNEEILSEKWAYWHPRDIDDDRELRNDPRPTWDELEGWSK